MLCITAIAAWQAAFLGPLGEQVAATTARIGLERKRAATAREVEQLKKSLTPHRELVGPADDVHELIRHVMDRLRSSPLRLVDLKPEKPKDLGPFQAIGLQLSLEGAYADIDQFLGWAETEQAADADRLDPAHAQLARAGAPLGEHHPAGPGRQGHPAGEDQGRARKDPMNASRLIKLAPNAILLALPGLCGLLAPVRASRRRRGADGPREGIRSHAAGPGRVRQGRDAPSSAQIRNPFLVVAPPSGRRRGRRVRRGRRTGADKLAEISPGLTLDATFIQGRDQLAIINGRIYHKGQSSGPPRRPGED